jgi:hypothetical protein
VGACLGSCLIRFIMPWGLRVNFLMDHSPYNTNKITMKSMKKIVIKCSHAIISSPTPFSWHYILFLVWPLDCFIVSTSCGLTIHHGGNIIFTVKHLEKICSVCGRHHISINFSRRNWEGYYAYSSRIGGKLCLFIGVRTLSFICLMIDIGLVHDKFCLMLYNR